MKACGLSLWQVATAPVCTGVVLALLCLYINHDLAPRSHFARRSAVAALGTTSPLELMEEGRFIQDFPGLTLYIGKRSGGNLTNVRIYDLREPGLRREIRASSGFVRASDDGKDLLVDLYDVRVDPVAKDRPGTLYCDKWPVRIKDALNRRGYRKKLDDYTFSELLTRIGDPARHYPHLRGEDLDEQAMAVRVEFNKRLSLSFSCFGFLLLGFPLGIKTHRKESSIGVGMSLFLVFNFYLFVIVAESMARRPVLRPDLIVWLPVFLSLLIGSRLIYRGD